MAEYYPEQNHITHFNLNISNKIKVEETIDIPNNESIFNIYLERKVGSVSLSDYDHGEASIEIKDYTTFTNKSIRCHSLKPNTENKYQIFTFRLKHDSSGRGKYSFEINIKCDQNLTLLIPTYGTRIKAKVENRDFIPIDQSAPVISSVSVKSDRYGKNASAAFKVSHEKYNITSASFTLYGLTYEQAYHRGYGNNEFTNCDSRNTSSSPDGTWYCQYVKTKNLSTDNYVEINLDDMYGGALDSGGQYNFTIIATAYNRKETRISGVLYVPQKVTGITCDTNVDLKIGDTEVLQYNIIPANAELSTVTFESVNIKIATISDTGQITAVGDGQCIIRVKTDDGGFLAECIVSTYSAEVFPQISELQLLTARDIRKISSACNFIRGKLLEKGADVSVFEAVNCTGKNHPVTEIKSLFEAIENNCQILKRFAADIGISTDYLSQQESIMKQNLNWYIVVNEWILFLNELYEKLIRS